MDYTREPIIETVITPREGCKLVVRNSKGAGQEEYFVDAIEVVSFGSSSFFRSIERPKPFLVPVSDYEILEVREARMVLKNVGLDRSIKIGGGREPSRPQKEVTHEKVEVAFKNEESVEEFSEETTTTTVTNDSKTDGRVDRKRERRRHYRRRRGGREEGQKEEASLDNPEIEHPIILPEPVELQNTVENEQSPLAAASSIVSSLLPPPPMLISETIERYKKKGLFKEAFFSRDEEDVKPVVTEVIEEEVTEEISEPISVADNPSSEQPEAVLEQALPEEPVVAEEFSSEQAIAITEELRSDEEISSDLEKVAETTENVETTEEQGVTQNLPSEGEAEPFVKFVEEDHSEEIIPDPSEISPEIEKSSEMLSNTQTDELPNNHHHS